MSDGYLGTDDEREGEQYRVVHHSCCLTLEDAHTAECRFILACRVSYPKGFGREMRLIYRLPSQEIEAVSENCNNIRMY